MYTKTSETNAEEKSDSSHASHLKNKANSSNGPQKSNWLPSTEKETYRTVVVNYRYAKIDNNYPRKTGAISKKKHWNRMIAALSAKPNSDEEEAEDDDVPNLRKLYDCSKEELRTSHTVNTPQPSCEYFSSILHEPPKEAVKLEVYCLPVEQEAIVEERQVNTIEQNETKSETIKDGTYNYDVTKSQENSDECVEESTDNSFETTQMARNYPSFSDFVFLADHEIGETPDFDADYCCAMTKDKIDGTQQTCIIKNTTKATQEPERNSEQLQTIKKSSKHSSSLNAQNCENCLELTIAEIPKGTGKPKSTQNQGGFRQRQQELHRYRVAVEQKRLELLEVKLQRERDEMLREQILFEKEIEFKTTQIRQLNDDKIVDIL
ncbi:PREDICTED: uncharacterized protein LOC108976721 [Bactrocera latifrons]|uniref:Uncharacterized protein n=1 Tax=Bactrocera latifrons TaxID=174628 RepID=A0A0K8UTH3_BACLA|nr:PREDICTED: uncharacterized protein LOC108976721 [Bactrocera latifrons]